MEEVLKLLDKSTLEILEYDLNVFYEDLGLDENRVNHWAETYTIQPSIYYVVKDTWVSNRIYLNAFKLDLAETRAIAPDFPMDEYDDDFFITLDLFISRCRSLPKSVKDRLITLPNLSVIDLDPDNHAELSW